MEAIQLEYKCCGATGAADWYSVSPFTEHIPDGPYVPLSCTVTGGSTGRSLVYFISIYPKGCVEVVVQRIQPKTYSLVMSAVTRDFVLTISLLIISFLHRYLKHRADDLSSNKPQKRHYVSNSQLLRAIQGTTLISEPRVVQMNTNADKNERSYKSDWILADNGQVKSEHISRIYTRRLDKPGQVKVSRFRRFLRSYAPLIEAGLYTDGNSRYEVEGNDYYGGYMATMLRVICSGLLGFLAAHIIVLAFLKKYRDAPKEGDIAKKNMTVSTKEEQIEILEEMMYLTTVSVRVCFVIAAIVSKRFRCFLILLGPNLALNAGQSFIAAELTSVAVVGPIRGLATNLRAAGETLRCLMHLSSNISSDANALLKPKSEKRTGDLETEEEGEEEEDEDDEEGSGNSTIGNRTEPSKKKKLKEAAFGRVKSLADFNKFFTRVIKMASKGIMKGSKKMMDLTMKMQEELLRDPYAEAVSTTLSPTAESKVSEEESKEIDATNAGVSDSFRHHLAEMDTTEKERMRVKKRAFQKNINKALSNLNLDLNATDFINSAIDLGHKIERNMRDRIVKACMLMKQGQVEQCNKAAVVACYNIQRDAIRATRLPIFIGPWCASQVTKGGACPTGEAVENAKADCSNIGYTLGLKDGFGVQFAVARSRLEEFAKSFQMGVKMKKLKEVAKKIWALRSGTKEALEQLSYMTLDVTRGAYAIAFLLATLMKLLFLFLLIKTQAYITNYLTKMEFDNIYVEDVFEQIDERRKNEGRMYLLPLKKYERKAVFWRRMAYTNAEWVRSIKSLIKSALLGIGLTFLFVADDYLYDILHILDIATQGDIAMGGGSRSADPTAGVTVRGGDGFAVALIKGILESFLSLANIDLSYKLSDCAPKVVAAASELRIRFALLWTTLLLLGLFSGYLLRTRHMIAGFFYPSAHRRRQMHLYNIMLANRARELGTHRNLLVQRVKENQLQQEVQELSKPPTITHFAPKLASKLMKGKANCVICHDVQKLGSAIYVCPVDDCATCRQCQQQILDDPKFCVACLDRNEESIDDTLLKLEDMYKAKAENRSEPY
ncbi:hypothetical protein Aperf_G00000097522 [Anoplocephala perfoliata]